MKNPLKINFIPPEENISKLDNSPQPLITSNIITTPCEKVLSILHEAKNFIQKFTKAQFALISNLDWAIEIISSRSLYSYEIKEKEKVNKLSQENPEFKALVDFVSEYNEKVIKMSRKYNSILTDKLLQKPSINLNKKKLKRKSSFIKENSKLLNILDSQDQGNTISTKTSLSNNNMQKDIFTNNIMTKAINNEISENNNRNKTEVNNNKASIKKQPQNINKKKNQQKINIKNRIDRDKNNSNKKNVYANQDLGFLKGYFNPNTIETKGQTRKKSEERKTKNKFIFFPSVQKISITINNNDLSNKKDNKLNTENSDEKRQFNTIDNIEMMNIKFNSDKTEREKEKEKENVKKGFGTDKGIPHISKNHFPFINIQNRLIHEGYDISKIINEKNFDIFTLKDTIGYGNVLPFVGRVILENLGLIDEEILCVQKLDPFLIAVNNQYKPEVLYHNCLHGTDVTQSCYTFFTYSNAEKIAKTNVLDLLSIFIAALGHDIAHPGLTNTFHINDSTDIAITYNDISVLENYHASTLFKTIRRSETNIFEKLTQIDYKIIRKRIISEILATDMALHGKVISLIKSKMTFNEDDNTYRLNLLSGDERTRSDEQQSLLDFMIHLADLAHNTRLFNISIKWVELLSEEFWRQGDLEKEHNLPISFLCDRENTNVPQSQKGFISGFILSTYEVLGNIFPSLRFTYENANNNLKEWQKLFNEGRKRGWTPKKSENQNKDRKKFKKSITKKFDIKNFKFLNGLNEKNVNIDEIENENEDKKVDEKKVEKNTNFNSVKTKKSANIDLFTITEKNNVIKKSLFNPINNDVIRKNSNMKISSKLKLSIIDDSPITDNKNVCSEFKLINTKKERINTENKMYKCNDKFVSKKNANKKRIVNK